MAQQIRTSRGMCPIPDCEKKFAQGHIGIDTHVKGRAHDKDFPELSGEARYQEFKRRFPPASWPLVGESTKPRVKNVRVVDNSDFLHSTYREKLIEHLFIAELLQEGWVSHRLRIDVLRSEIDASGYDLVLELAGIVRHVQLKSTRKGARASGQNLNSRLMAKPAGCAIWILVEEDSVTKRMRLSYRFFGGEPNEPLPLTDMHKPAKHTKANALGVKGIRPAIRRVPAGCFESVENGVHDLLIKLFGEAALGAQI